MTRAQEIQQRREANGCFECDEVCVKTYPECKKLRELQREEKEVINEYRTVRALSQDTR